MQAQKSVRELSELTKIENATYRVTAAALRAKERRPYDEHLRRHSETQRYRALQSRMHTGTAGEDRRNSIGPQQLAALQCAINAARDCHASMDLSATWGSGAAASIYSDVMTVSSSTTSTRRFSVRRRLKELKEV